MTDLLDIFADAARTERVNCPDCLWARPADLDGPEWHRPSCPSRPQAAQRDASARADPNATAAPCGWCQGPIPPDARRDSKYCSQRCRQAAWRFHGPSRRAGATLSVASVLEPRRFAYADPPYPGLSKRYYREHPDFGGEVDHAELLGRLTAGYDGWALSTSAEALPSLLPACPTGTRVAAWFRGERPVKSYGPLVAWEPVLYFGARRYLSRGSPRRVDALVHHARPRLTDERRVIGAKPAAFCAWLFLLLGLQPQDELIDLFPGSGGVARAWETFRVAAADASSRPGGPDASRGAPDASLEYSETASG